MHSVNAINFSFFFLQCQSWCFHCLWCLLIIAGAGANVLRKSMLKNCRVMQTPALSLSFSFTLTNKNTHLARLLEQWLSTSGLRAESSPPNHPIRPATGFQNLLRILMLDNNDCDFISFYLSVRPLRVCPVSVTLDLQLYWRFTARCVRFPSFEYLFHSISLFYSNHKANTVMPMSFSLCNIRPLCVCDMWEVPATNWRTVCWWKQRTYSRFRKLLSVSI